MQRGAYDPVAAQALRRTAHTQLRPAWAGWALVGSRAWAQAAGCRLETGTAPACVRSWASAARHRLSVLFQ